MVRFQYSPLANQDEIRVIQLLTQRDHPRYATGPINCRIEHVSLNTSLRTTDGRFPAKDFDGTWPSPLGKDIATQTQIRDGGNSNMFWKKSLAERASGKIRSSVGPRPPSSSYCRNEVKHQTDYDCGVQLENPGIPWRYAWGDFVALSYVWGDPSVKREIFIGETSVLVTENLEAALHQLRNHSRIQEGFRIWIDALCINQADPEERAVQVSRMKDIYAKAWRVIVWLGPEAKKSTLAMMAIRFLSIRSQEKEPLHGIYHRVDRYIIRMPFFQWKHAHTSLRMRKAILRAIYHLLTRSYWRRLWIIQEVALAARRSPVLCGDSCIFLEDFHNALQVIQQDGAAFGRYIIRSAKGSGTLQRQWDSIKRDTYKISEKLWERPIAIIEAQPKQEPAAQTTYSSSFGALLLSLEAFCSDERDRVYGILGLPCLTGVVDILPDYNRSPAEIFITFSESLFMSGDLNGLSLIRNAIPPIATWYFKPTYFSRPRAPKLVWHHRTINRGCRHALPSWVICCSCPPNPVLPLPRSFSALSTQPYIARPIFRDRLLIAQGVIFDTLSTLSAFHATESNRKYPQNGPRRTSIYGSESATKEAFWRTLVANTDRSSQPAPAEYCMVLDPLIWTIGITGVDNNIYGLKDFYQRNKSLVIFDQTISQLIHGPKKTMAQQIKRTFKTTGRLLRATPLQRDATVRAMRVLAWRRLVTTSGGYLGLVPAGAIAGDVVAMIIGCNVPLLLRPVKWETARFSVIGECYVHGVMYGEVVEFLEQGKCKMDSISIL